MKRTALLAWLFVFAPVQAGLYYRGEVVADLPCAWRGYLLDQRQLRMLALPNPPASPFRDDYAEALARWLPKRDQLAADDLADLGAVQLRLGQIDAALETLRLGQRKFPDHFALHANLGTAWQLQGDLDAAAEALRTAVRLAPPAQRKAEELHLRLVQSRRTKSGTGLDDLFGVRYGDAQGNVLPGGMDAAERAKLPPDAIGQVQRLSLALPADGRLLWQLGELANAYGDVNTAANLLEGCVTEFNLNDATFLRDHRNQLRTAVEKLAKDPKAADAQTAHSAHSTGGIQFRSTRALQSKVNLARLPAIKAEGVNALPWFVLAETRLERGFKPQFPKHLTQLEGKRVSLTGFMQPTGDDLEISSFLLLEFPVGCWFCETPEATGLVLVDLPAGKHMTLQRHLVKVTGVLKLNLADPEQFLYGIENATVGESD